MDKYEYRIKAEQIVKLFGRKDYATAMKIADGIDWNRVKNVQMLCTVSEVYEKNQKYEESRDVLLLAYDRSPIGRMIVYRLVELSILLKDFDEAIAYYKEYEQIAPNDTNIYILKYKIYKGKEATTETLISILEEFKRKDYHEEWALELARLYHEGGYTEKCIEECDEIDLWFNNGPSVIAALELKMCYCPLTPSQEEKYSRRAEVQAEAEVEDLEMLLQKPKQENEELPEESAEQEKSESIEEESFRKMDEELSVEDTQLKSREIKEEKDTFESEEESDIKAENQSPADALKNWDLKKQSQILIQKTKEIPVITKEKLHMPEQEEEITVPFFTDMEVNKYDTLNLQKELARSIQQLLNATEKKTVDVTLQNVKKMVEDSHIPELTETMRFRTIRSEMLNRVARQRAKELEQAAKLDAEISLQKEPIQDQQYDKMSELKAIRQSMNADMKERPVPEPTLKLKLTEKEKKRNLEKMLTQEDDGQIGLLIPDEVVVEKQITGQMNIEDILREREKQKLLSENDRDKLALEEARKCALEETQEIMNEIMGLLKDVIPKIGSLRDGEERIASLADSLEKVQNSLPAFSKDILQDAENMKEEVLSADIELARAADEKDVLEELYAAEAQNEDFLEAEQMEEDNDAADVLEAKIGESIPEEISILAVEAENECDMDQDLFSNEDDEEPEDQAKDITEVQPAEEDINTEMEIAIAGEESEEQELLEKAFVEMQKSIQEEDESRKVKDIDPDFAAEQMALQQMFAADSQAAAQEEPPVADSYDETSDMENERQDQPEEDALSAASEMKGNDDEKADADGYLNEEQKDIFAYFMSVGGMEKKLAEVLKQAEQRIEHMIITGVAGSGKTSLAMRIVKALQVGKEEKIDLIAKIKGASLNQKDIQSIFEKIEGGALIIEKAGALSGSSMKKLEEVMDQYKGRVQVFLADKESAIAKLRQHGKTFMDRFAVQIDLPVYTNSELVEFGKAYARVKGYAIDDVGVLALYSQIGIIQTEKQTAALNDIKDIVDSAVQRAEKRGKKVFGKIFSRKKQNEKILFEDDFTGYRKS